MKGKILLFKRELGKKSLNINGFNVSQQSFEFWNGMVCSERQPLDLGNVAAACVITIKKGGETLSEADEKKIQKFYELMRGVCCEVFGD